MDVLRQSEFEPAITEVKVKKVGIDVQSCSQAVFELLKKNDITVKELSGKDLPVSSLKILKNETEVDGLRQAYIRESAALISVYAKIKKTIETAVAFSTSLHLDSRFSMPSRLAYG